MNEKSTFYIKNYHLIWLFAMLLLIIGIVISVSFFYITEISDINAEFEGTFRTIAKYVRIGYLFISGIIIVVLTLINKFYFKSIDVKKQQCQKKEYFYFVFLVLSSVGIEILRATSGYLDLFKLHFAFTIFVVLVLYLILSLLISRILFQNNESIQESFHSHEYKNLLRYFIPFAVVSIISMIDFSIFQASWKFSVFLFACIIFWYIQNIIITKTKEKDKITNVLSYIQMTVIVLIPLFYYMFHRLDLLILLILIYVFMIIYLIKTSRKHHENTVFSITNLLKHLFAFFISIYFSWRFLISPLLINDSINSWAEEVVKSAFYPYLLTLSSYAMIIYLFIVLFSFFEILRNRWRKIV
ncbi:MAG: hypothetical protein KJ971_08430 [Firmicutes bacterium]|nr:hypothetical protein [Bacillota bacterium]